MKILEYITSRCKIAALFSLECVASIFANIIVMPSVVWATYAYMVWLDILPGLPAERPLGLPFSRELALMLLGKFLIVGLQEETVFRYLLQDKLFKGFFKIPTKYSIVTARVLFGAAHLANGWGIPFSVPQAVGATCAGLLWGYIYEKRGLAMCMLSHGLYDFVVVSVSLFGKF